LPTWSSIEFETVRGAIGSDVRLLDASESRGVREYSGETESCGLSNLQRFLASALG